MRRFRLRTGRTALFLAMLVLAMLALLPMRLVLGWIGLGEEGLGEQGLSARTVRGSVWSGTLSEARVGDVALGDLRAALSPLPLLIGRARLDLASRAEPPTASLVGAMSVTRHSFGLDDVTATIPAGRAFLPLPTGSIELTDLSVLFRDGNCERAEGRVRATLAGSVGGVSIGQTLSGAARCEAGMLLLPLVGQAETETATVRVRADGRYNVELTLNPSDPTIGQALQLSGFVQTARGWQLSVEGRF